MNTLGGETPEMSSVDIKGTLFRKQLTFTIIGQRVFPQRNRDPLHKTQRLLPDVLATIWLSPVS
jgi:hypothetical protein